MPSRSLWSPTDGHASCISRCTSLDGGTGGGANACAGKRMEHIMRFGRRTLISGGLGLLLGASVATGGAGVLAQDATPVATADLVTAPNRPAHIHLGTCSELGEVVAPLTGLTLAGGGTGADESVSDDIPRAIPAEYSFTTVPLSLDEILATDHAINVRLSPDAIETYIACGELAGPVDANGTLVVGLRELNDSDYSGIAVLSPSAQAAGSTDVSVFIAGGLAGGADVANGLDTGGLVTPDVATPEGGS